METRITTARQTSSGESGFTLIEVLVSVMILVVISATALDGLMNLSKNTRTVTNRTEMHAGVRNATELLQQEVGQAGRVVLPGVVTLSAAVAVGATTFTVSDVTGMWAGQYLTVDTGGNIDCTDDGLGPAPPGKCSETVKVQQINGNTITVETNDAISKGHIAFWWAHDAGAPITIVGAFAQGVVPKSVANGSTDFLLKIFGDINGTGNMVYIEYWCDVNGGNLYRREVPYTSAVKPGPTDDQVLLNNVTTNPGNAPCFVYQEQPVLGMPFVTDVAITLTVQTATVDATTGLFQQETKALLNVSPRNVFNVWQMANQGMLYRVQPMPPSVAALLALP